MLDFNPLGESLSQSHRFRWLVGGSRYSWPVGWAMFPLTLLEGYFLNFVVFIAHTNLTAEYSKGIYNRFLEVLSMQSLTVQSILRTLLAVISCSPVAQFWSAVITLVPLPAHAGELSGSKLRQLRAHLICFPSLKVHSFPCLMSVSWEPLFLSPHSLIAVVV